MNKQELKFILKFQDKLLAKCNSAFIEAMLNLVPMNTEQSIPLMSKMIDEMTAILEPQTFIMRACITQFVSDKYSKLLK